MLWYSTSCSNSCSNSCDRHLLLPPPPPPLAPLRIDLGSVPLVVVARGGDGVPGGARPTAQDVILSLGDAVVVESAWKTEGEGGGRREEGTGERTGEDKRGWVSKEEEQKQGRNKREEKKRDVVLRLYLYISIYYVSVSL